MRYPSEEREFQIKSKSKKWSTLEVEQLLGAIHDAGCAPEALNWAAVAEQVAGRTGKQCREKYKVCVWVSRVWVDPHKTGRHCLVSSSSV
jgi:hypothetical protein